MVSELIEARDDKKLLRFQKQIASYELLIVDELGFVHLSKTGAELLFEMLIPATRMKMKTPHIIPLPFQAIEVLELLQTISGGHELVVPGEQDPKKPMSDITILKALERMGYKGRMTGHGFRGLASTILHEQGYNNHDHIELQLAHAPRNAVSAAYNHALYLGPRAKMMQDWSDFLERTQRGGKVLPFCGNVA